jgi:hypothetical protein
MNFLAQNLTKNSHSQRLPVALEVKLFRLVDLSG